MAKFEPGQSGNPGGRPKSKELRDLCRTYTADAVKELARLALESKSERVRVVAITEILDRGYGRPMQAIEVAVDDARPTQEDQRDLTPIQVLEALGNILSKAEKEMGIDPINGLSNTDRMKRLVQSGQTLPPDLYKAWLQVAPEIEKTGGPEVTWQ